MRESTLRQRRQVAAAKLEQQDKNPCTQPWEPILFHSSLLERIVYKPWRPAVSRGMNPSIDSTAVENMALDSGPGATSSNTAPCISYNYD